MEVVCVPPVSSNDEWQSLFDEILSSSPDAFVFPESKASGGEVKLTEDTKIDPKIILDSLDIPDEIEEKDIETINYTFCERCNVPCKIYNDIKLICEKCGVEKEWDTHMFETYTSTLDCNYNTNNNSFMNFTIIGANSYCYNRSFLKTCADYVSYRTNTNKKEIVNRIYQFEGRTPPNNIINFTADLFEQIKLKGYVYRGDGKLGVMAACLYYACVMNGLSRSPKEIAMIMQIEERALSHGDKILQELNEIGVISIPILHKPLYDYINQYFPLLDIPEKYKAFIIHLINRMEKKHIHVKNECKMTTKVVGAIYMLTQRIPELKHISKETLCKECGNISKATISKYYNIIMHNPEVVKKSFKKFGIPMPKSFKIAKN